jgi:hypothetical protein
MTYQNNQSNPNNFDVSEVVSKCNKCNKCGISGIHACSKLSIPPMTNQEKNFTTAMNEVLPMNNKTFQTNS